MWTELLKIPALVNLNKKTSSIDNWVFKLHYRVTSAFLLIIATGFWSSEFFAKPIRCSHSRQEDFHTSNEALDRFKDRWCYFMGIHTVTRHYEKTSENGEVPFAGVGPIRPNDVFRDLGWYQWVYYVLLLQAIMFYIPRVIWRLQEKKTVNNFVIGVNFLNIFDDTEKWDLLNKVKNKFQNRVTLNKSWPNCLIACEFLNLLNVIGQWFITDRFLDGYFQKLGLAAFEDLQSHEFSRLDIAFPKMSKCTYFKYAMTGQIQNEDLICVLPYNLFYEKVYLVLWFWFIILGFLSVLAVLHRIFSWLSYTFFGTFYIRCYKVGRVCYPKIENIEKIMKNHTYREWLFLQYITFNLEDKMGVELISSLAKYDKNTNGFGYVIMT